MQNFIQRGDTVSFTNTEAVVAGQGATMGQLFGVAATDAEPGETFEASVVGVFELPKAAGVIAAGARVYWRSDIDAVTTVASGNRLIGASIIDAADGATTTVVRLNGIA